MKNLRQMLDFWGVQDYEQLLASHTMRGIAVPLPEYAPHSFVETRLEGQLTSGTYLWENHGTHCVAFSTRDVMRSARTKDTRSSRFEYAEVRYTVGSYGTLEFSDTGRNTGHWYWLGEQDGGGYPSYTSDREGRGLHALLPLPLLLSELPSHSIRVSAEERFHPHLRPSLEIFSGYELYPAGTMPGGVMPALQYEL